MKKLYLPIAVSLLVSCGNSPKVDPVLSGGKASRPESGPCKGDYLPISVFRLDIPPVADPENLPPGTYENRGTEYYARDDQGPAGVQHAHFQEIFFNESGVIQPVCHTVINREESTEYSFPAFLLLTIPVAGAKSRVDATYLIQNNHGTFRSGRLMESTPVAGGLSGVLAKFTQARLYKTGANSYELRGELQQATVRGTVTKWLLQRISFTPAGSI